MDFVKLERRLERAFTGRPVQVGAGSIVWRRKPVLLWQLVAASLDEEEQAEEPDLEAWPGNVNELLGGRDRALLGFYWDGFGPTSFVAGLTLLELQRSSYLCHWDEIESYGRSQSWKAGVSALSFETPWVSCCARTATRTGSASSARSRPRQPTTPSG